MRYILLFLIICLMGIGSCLSVSFFDPINLETGRLIIRPIALSDAQDLFACTSDSQVSQYTALFSVHYSVQKTEHFINKLLKERENHQAIPLVIMHKADNKVIGLCTIYGYAPISAKAEIAYAIARPYWGQGLATEALRSLIEYFFVSAGLNRIQAVADPRNGASCRVLEKCGFCYEGTLRQYYNINHKFCDRNMYSIIASDFF